MDSLVCMCVCVCVSYVRAHLCRNLIIKLNLIIYGMLWHSCYNFVETTWFQRVPVDWCAANKWSSFMISVWWLVCFCLFLCLGNVGTLGKLYCTANKKICNAWSIQMYFTCVLIFCIFWLPCSELKGLLLVTTPSLTGLLTDKTLAAAVTTPSLTGLLTDKTLAAAVAGPVTRERTDIMKYAFWLHSELGRWSD